ncbi:hypothetical protein DB32_000654 [Sandaracinus amylolyticus]|uniref:Uncharacterized protein n=1 Tax=Sandaracinus amylolyticus TaxID=927083 RepID=A0A0F6VZD7_9BACT|nr:hypothetical protein DB32_000654 [Sandaracinus amylolyticus]
MHDFSGLGGMDSCLRRGAGLWDRLRRRGGLRCATAAWVRFSPERGPRISAPCSARHPFRGRWNPGHLHAQGPAAAVCFARGSRTLPRVRGRGATSRLAAPL